MKLRLTECKLIIIQRKRREAPHTVVAMADPESLNRSISEAVSRTVSETARSVFAQIGIQTKLYSLW